LREARGLSQATLGEQADLTREYINKLEAGRYDPTLGALQRLAREAGVPGRLLHDFRRTAVRNLEPAGVARSVAVKIPGDKTVSVSRRYAIVSDLDLREAALKLTNDASQGHNHGHSSTLPLDTYSATSQNP